MANGPKSCWMCASYDRGARRCRIGKANPRRKLDAVDVARLLGTGALCMHNPHREPLLLRMYMPKQRFKWTVQFPPGCDNMEIEIVED